ncbi:MAG TPA: FAD:protein FMN transferase, partial [Hanamia sp.]
MSAQKLFKKGLKLMGNHFEISAVGNEETWANERIDEGISEIQRIEKLLTTFNESSETSLIN